MRNISPVRSKREVLEHFKSLGADDESLAIASRWDDSFESIVNALILYKDLRVFGHEPAQARAELVRRFGYKPDYVKKLVSGKGYAKQREEAEHRRKAAC